VEFRLLGLLEVVTDDGPIRIVRGRESALLALLLLHSNQPLPTDRIVEELWGAAAPENAAKSVHIYVSRLRKALGADRIETTSAGYRMRVDTDELDCERFSRYAAEGKRREALALWRGEPLADFRFEAFAQSEIRRLEAMRDDLWMDELDVRLDSGRVADAIPELTALVEREPLWERPRGQLMRALYLAGRQTEALELYRSTRTLLSDELGVEPGRELQRVERAILNQDPSLGKPSGPMPSTAGRHRYRLLVAGALVVAVAAAAVVGIELSRSTKQALPYVPDSLARLDVASGRIDGVLPLAGTPGPVTISNDRAWVASTSRTISAVALDSLQTKLLATPELSAGELVSSGGRLWAVGADGGAVSELDSVYGTLLHRIALPADLDNVAVRMAPAVTGGVWITSGTRLLRYDRAGNRTATVDLHRPLTDIVEGLGRLWVLSGPTAALLELNDRTAAQLGAAIRLELRPGFDAPSPIALTVGSGAIWVLAGSPASVIRVDPRIGAVVTTILLGIGSDPTSIAAGQGRVWVADSGDGTIARVDASDNSLRRLVVGGSPANLVVGGRHLWVTMQAGLSANNGGIPSPLPGPRAGTIGLPSNICSPVYAQGQPDVILAGDLPLQGGGGTLLSLQLSNAIRYVLAVHHFRAGSLSVGYQLCDDSSASAGRWTRPTCRADARAIAADDSVVGVIGPFNSGCAIVELPILAHARGGAVPVISPSATYIGLTHGGVGALRGEPAAYRANRQPIFMRVVAADDRQGTANAILAKHLKVRRLYMLEDGSSYGRGITAALQAAAPARGIKIVGRADWPTDNTRGYRAPAHRVALARPDGVFLAGTIDEGGAPLLRQLRTALGSRVRFLLSDGFTPFPAVLATGPAAENVTITVPAPALSRLPDTGRAFVKAFAKAIGQEPQPYSITAAEATQAMLTALASSDGSRGSLRRHLLTTRFNGILGNFRFDQNGDTTSSVVSVYTIKNGRVLLLTTITPPARSRQ
jgi:branched-chain amino acid transport system substrate-binding protein